MFIKAGKQITESLMTDTVYKIECGTLKLNRVQYHAGQTISKSKGDDVHILALTDCDVQKICKNEEIACTIASDVTYNGIGEDDIPMPTPKKKYKKAVSEDGE